MISQCRLVEDNRPSVSMQTGVSIDGAGKIHYVDLLTATLRGCLKITYFYASPKQFSNRL